ncbi:MAG: GNAT family N-acetyltransferase [Rhizobiaceae bacterium]|nr:GNAT family N-acetyltransferase [Rhizobiaceae bacterium]
MNGFFVRTAGERDLAEVSRLLAETWHATYDVLYGADQVATITASWHTVEALRQRLAKPHSEFLVADDGERLPAMAFAAAAGEGRTVLLHQLYVLPAFQRLGIGSELLGEVEGCFPTADLIRVEVEEANLKALSFYTSRGFVTAASTGVTALDAPERPALLLEKRLA